MTRTIQGFSNLNEGDTLNLVLCDKYGNRVNSETTSVTVGEEGSFSVSLQVNQNDTCWKTSNTEVMKTFWVYKGDETQTLDLTQEILPRNRLDTFVFSDMSTTVLNAENMLQGLLCGRPFIAKEEERFFCRYEGLYKGEEDEYMCEIDGKVGM